MATECRIVGSATAPVQEVIDNEVHGLLADFYDVEGLTANALRILRDPQQFIHLGTSARARVLERYEKTRCIAELVEFFESVKTRGRPSAASAKLATPRKGGAGLS
jgi:glycosyltransferase involved in cell wall biosynthesis